MKVSYTYLGSPDRACLLALLLSAALYCTPCSSSAQVSLFSTLACSTCLLSSTASPAPPPCWSAFSLFGIARSHAGHQTFWIHEMKLCITVAMHLRKLCIRLLGFIKLCTRQWTSSFGEHGLLFTQTSQICFAEPDCQLENACQLENSRSKRLGQN